MLIPPEPISPPEPLLPPDEIDNVYKHILSILDSNIILLKDREVIEWIFGIPTFLPAIEKTNKSSDESKYKQLEDEWGRKVLKTRRPDLKLDKQWTNKFGEHICEEIYTLLGKTVSKPVKKEHYQPDLEIDDAIIEVKTGTYYTSGTAGEKILGVPNKYAEIPELYNKKLYIVCFGGAEHKCRNEYGVLPGTKQCGKTLKKFLDCYRDNNIEYIAASDLLRSLV